MFSDEIPEGVQTKSNCFLETLRINSASSSPDNLDLLMAEFIDRKVDLTSYYFYEGSMTRPDC